MPFGYPVMLELRGRRALVIGAAAVRQAKVDTLLAAGADVTVRENGAWDPADLNGVFICVASSDDGRERDAIAREARARGVLVNVMDDVPNCDFAAPAVVRRGELLIAIGTGGRSPALARRLREDLSGRFGPEWADVLDLLAEVRSQTREALPDLPERSHRWQLALDPEEVAALIRAGRREEARALLLERLAGAGAGTT